MLANWEILQEERVEAIVSMKVIKSAAHWKTRALSKIQFEDQQLTSFAELIVFDPLLQRLRLK